MLTALPRIVAGLTACAFAWAVSGCGLTQTAGTGGSSVPVSTAPVGGFQEVAFSGRVMTGPLPLHGASVQLYAAGTAGNGSAPTQLLTAALVSDTDGKFAVAANSYTCPSADSVLYIVATGGSAGANGANAAIKLVTVPGPCGSVGGGATVVLNELTTVATAFALRPFLSAGGHLGSTATNVQGLELAVATLGRLVDLRAGTAPGAGFAANGTAPVAKLNTLANVLHGCVAAQASGDGCTSLFAQTTFAGAQPADTLDAALAVANHTGLRLAPVDLANRTFSPALAAAPADWTLGIPYTGGGMKGPAGISIDAMGQVWVANYFGVASLFANSGVPVFPDGVRGHGIQESYGGAVDATGRMWVANEQNDDATMNSGIGSISVLSGAGPALPEGSVLLTGGLNFPVAIAFDRSGNAWVVDYGDSHLTVLNASGVPQSGTKGYMSDQLVFPVAVAADSQGNGWVANQSANTVTRVSEDGSRFTSFAVGPSPSGVAVDAADNVWTANFYGNSVGLVSAKAQVVSGAGFVGGGLNHPAGIAVDGAGTAWVANYRAPGISVLAGARVAEPGSALSGDQGWGSDVHMLEAFGIAIDAAGNVWVTSYGDDRVVEFPGIATPVKTPLLGGVRLP